MTFRYASAGQLQQGQLDIACNGGQALQDRAVGGRANAPTGWKPFDASRDALIAAAEAAGEPYFMAAGRIDGMLEGHRR